MDEDTNRPAEGPDAPETPGRTPGAPVVAPREPAAPLAEPEPAAEPLRLPLEPTDADAPIPYALTARARRIVAPHEVPDLQVVTGPDEAPDAVDQLDDPRSVQARALRRAGMPVAAIASRLGVDNFTVRAWLGGRLAPVAVPSGHVEEQDSTPAEAAALRAFDDRVATDPTFAAGIAVLGAIADVDGGAVVLASDRPAPLAQGLAFLRQELGVGDHQVRVVLRLGALLAGDRAVADWSTALGLPVDRFRHVRSGRVGAPDGIEVLVRVTGAAVAERTAVWLHRHQLGWRPASRSVEAPAG